MSQCEDMNLEFIIISKITLKKVKPDRLGSVEEHRPNEPGVNGLIPSKGAYPGCGFDP